MSLMTSYAAGCGLVCTACCQYQCRSCLYVYSLVSAFKGRPSMKAPDSRHATGTRAHAPRRRDGSKKDALTRCGRAAPRCLLLREAHRDGMKTGQGVGRGWMGGVDSVDANRERLCLELVSCFSLHDEDCSPVPIHSLDACNLPFFPFAPVFAALAATRLDPRKPLHAHFATRREDTNTTRPEVLHDTERRSVRPLIRRRRNPAQTQSIHLFCC